MSSIDATINAGIAALQRKNRQMAVDIAKQLADRASTSEDPTNVEVGGQLSDIASRLGAQPTGPASASGSGFPPPPPPPPPSGRYPPAGPQPGFRGLPPGPQPPIPPGRSPKDLKSLETSLKDIWAGGDSVLMLPGQTRSDVTPSAPRNPERLQAWNALLGLQRAAIATRDLTQPKEQKQGRNPGTNTNFVKEVQKFMEAKSQYLLTYAGVQDEPPPVVPARNQANMGNAFNPFTDAGAARLAAERANPPVDSLAQSDAAVRAGLREINERQRAENAEVSARVQARRVADDALARAQAQEAAARDQTAREAAAREREAQEAASRAAQEAETAARAALEAAARTAGFASHNDQEEALRDLQNFATDLDTNPGQNIARAEARLEGMRGRYANTALEDDYTRLLGFLATHVNPLNRARLGALQPRPAVRPAPVVAAAAPPVVAATAAAVPPVSSIEEARIAALPEAERRAYINRQTAAAVARANAETVPRRQQIAAEKAAVNQARNRTAKNLGYRNAKNQQEDDAQFAEIQRRVQDPATDLATIDAFREIVAQKGRNFASKPELVRRYDQLEQGLIRRRAAKLAEAEAAASAAAAAASTAAVAQKKANVVARTNTARPFVNPIFTPRSTPYNPYPNLERFAAAGDLNGPPLPPSATNYLRKVGAPQTLREKQAAAAERRRREEAAAAASRNRSTLSLTPPGKLPRQKPTALTRAVKASAAAPPPRPPPRRFPVPLGGLGGAPINRSFLSPLSGNAPLAPVISIEDFNALPPSTQARYRPRSFDERDGRHQMMGGSDTADYVLINPNGGNRISRKKRRNGRKTQKKSV